MLYQLLPPCYPFIFPSLCHFSLPSLSHTSLFLTPPSPSLSHYLYQHNYICLPTIIYLPSSTYLHQHTYLLMPIYQQIPTYHHLPPYLPLPIPKFQYIIAADLRAGIGLVTFISFILFKQKTDSISIKYLSNYSPLK